MSRIELLPHIYTYTHTHNVKLKFRKKYLLFISIQCAQIDANAPQK